MSRISETSLQTELSLTVGDLEAAVRFYAVLFDVPPSQRWPEFARFQIDEPPLLLTLRSGIETHAGAINHLGFRLEDSAQLVAIQHRLEIAGYGTNREDGVECCYSRQTKFWATDPEGNLWEIYSLDDDPADSPTSASPTASEESLPVVWGHRIGTPLCLPIPFADGVVDEIHLDRTVSEASLTIESMVVREAVRAVKPGGTLAVSVELSHWEGIPAVLKGLVLAGFVAPRVESWQSRGTGGAGTLSLSAVKPEATVCAEQEWLYRGPAAVVELDDGRIIRRAERAVASEVSPFLADFTAFPRSH